MAARPRVLAAFKEIHRTCQSVYAGNKKALRASRWKINREFKRFKDETAPKKIEDHIQFARDASRLVRLTAEQGEPSRNRFVYDERQFSKKTFHNRPQSVNDDNYDDYPDYRKKQHYPDYRRKQHYADYGRKQQHKRKPQYVDWSNFDAWEMTVKRR